jgi:hypothetical protein
MVKSEVSPSTLLHERPQVAGGGDGIQIWRVAARTIRVSRTANVWRFYKLVANSSIPRRTSKPRRHMPEQKYSPTYS